MLINVPSFKNLMLGKYLNKTIENYEKRDSLQLLVFLKRLFFSMWNDNSKFIDATNFL